MKLPVLLLLGSLLVAAPLKTHTELSYIQTNGNTDTKSFGFDFHGQKSWEPHTLALDFEANYAESEGNETKNVWLCELHYYYRFTKKIDFTYLIGYKEDKFSGFDHQFYTGPGLSWNVMQTHDQNLSLDTLLLHSIDSYARDGCNVYTSARVGALYTYQILPTLKFVEEANIRSEISEPSNWFLYSKTSLYNTIQSNLKLGISYKIDYANKPPEGKDKSDRTFMVSLVVDW